MTKLTKKLKAAGFDLHYFFDVDDYNRAVNKFYLPDFERASTQGLIVGNTRQLWDPFIEYLHREPTRLEGEDPLDHYTERVIHNALEMVEPETRVIWAHRAEPEFFPMRQVAEKTGFAFEAPCQMSIHPKYGLWFALRGVVVFDADAKITSKEVETQNHPCTNCSEPCMDALERALSLDQPDWEDWARIRSSCPVSGFRYPENQRAYHYTKKAEYLDK